MENENGPHGFKWSRLCAAYIGCVLAAGPIVGWQVWQPLLIEAGFCGEACSSQTSSLSLVSFSDVSKLQEALAIGITKEGYETGLIVRNLTRDDDDQLKRVVKIGGTEVATFDELNNELKKAGWGGGWGGHPVSKEFFGNQTLKNPLQVELQLEEGCDAQLTILGNMYTVAAGCSQMSVLPLGIIFDRYGPRWTAMDGALTCAFGLALIIVAIQIDQSNLALVSGLGYAGLFIADIGSYLNSYSMNGFLFLMPEHQSFIVSLTGSSYAGAALLAMLPNLLVQIYGWPFHLSLYVMCGIALFGMSLGYFCPNHEEYLEAARTLLGDASLRARPLMESVCSTWEIVKQHLLMHVIFGACFVSMNVFFLYYGSVLFPLVTHFLDSPTKASEVMDWYNMFYAVLGIIAGPIAGKVADLVGFPCYIGLATIFQAFFSACIFIPTYEGQLLAAFICCCWSPLITFIINRWCVYYAPPDLLGTLMGLLMFLSGAISASLNSAVEFEANAMLEGVAIYAVPSGALAFLSLVTAFIFTIAVCCRPPPSEPPSLSNKSAEYKLQSMTDSDEEGALEPQE